MVAADYPDMAYERFAVQNTEYGSKLSGKSLLDVLEKRGVLLIFKNLVPEVLDLLKSVEQTFHFMEKGRHAHDLNKILGHLKDTWSRALDDVMRSHSPSEVVDVNAFNTFVQRYQALLDTAISNDRGLEGSDVLRFSSQLEHLFRALESAYAVLYFALQDLHLPIQLTWMLFSPTRLIVKSIPDNLFDPNMLGDLMRTPRELMNQFTHAFDELFQQLMDSPAGQYVPLIINMIQSMSMKQRSEHDEF